MIAKFLYHSEKLCITKFCRDCEIFAMVAKFSQCHSENPALSCIAPAFSSASISSIPLDISSIPLDISSSRLDEITENSYEHGINRHQDGAKLEMMDEAPKTCKTTKNNLETISVVLNGPAHVNRRNSYD